MSAEVRVGDAAELLREMPDRSVHAVVTSPPYWMQRDYGVAGQIGREPTPDAYIAALVGVWAELARVLRPDGVCWLNIGDKWVSKRLQGLPWRVAAALQQAGWIVRSEIVWSKEAKPEPATDRPRLTHELVLVLARSPRYRLDRTVLREAGLDRTVWEIPVEPRRDVHDAQFPLRLAAPMVEASTSQTCCAVCGAGWERMLGDPVLDASRPQTRRALELAEQHRLTPEHLAAIRATGITDAGANRRTSSGTGRNSADVQRLAAEAKTALGGYFREFLLGRRPTIGWQPSCGHHDADETVATVLDPFSGTGTTLVAARQLGRHAIGLELNPQSAALARQRVATEGVPQQQELTDAA